MELQLDRFSDDGDSTLGLLFEVGTRETADRLEEGFRDFWCFTLEDEYRTKKVHGETRIPDGRYEIRLRDEGGMTQRYAKRFPLIHRGMLHLQDVPGFEWIYIHVGSKEDHTDGCILVGDSCKHQRSRAEAFVGHSSACYVRIYCKIVSALEEGQRVFIRIVDRTGLVP